MNPAQLVKRLLERDMPVEVVGPVSAQALEPFPFDQPFNTLHDVDCLVRSGRQRRGHVDARNQAQGHKLARFRFKHCLARLESAYSPRIPDICTHLVCLSHCWRQLRGWG